VVRAELPLPEHEPALGHDQALAAPSPPVFDGPPAAIVAG
jgi:hypothetical protein